MSKNGIGDKMIKWVDKRDKYNEKYYVIKEKENWEVLSVIW